LHLGDDLAGRTTALTVSEVAKILSVSERQVYKLAALDELPSFRVGGALRFDPAAITAWIDAAEALHKFPPGRVGAVSARRRA
jgi:excisionase family DNA binding protein